MCNVIQHLFYYAGWEPKWIKTRIAHAMMATFGTGPKRPLLSAMKMRVSNATSSTTSHGRRVQPVYDADNNILTVGTDKRSRTASRLHTDSPVARKRARVAAADTTASNVTPITGGAVTARSGSEEESSSSSVSSSVSSSSLSTSSVLSSDSDDSSDT